ncbi:MAG: glycoside hydrolase family 16 protein [Planctomycetota bacterium]
MKVRLARLWSFFPFVLCLLVWVAAVGWSATLNRALADEADVLPAYPGYQLVWHDEFDVDGPPNPDNWTASNGGFERNHELQWYQPDNVWVEGGHLVIEARRERRASPMHDPTSEDWRRTRTHIDYTSALVTSAGKQAFQYGRFEIRAKIRAEDGLWPAIWTLGVDGPWPARGEIDIMEYYPGQILANAAWKKDQWRWSANWDSTKTPIEELGDPQTWDDDFHVWRMDWDESFIRLYVDGRLLNEIDLSKTYNETPEANNPFRQPHFILLNLALGGDNGGDPSGTDFPSAYLVDYVRVYQPIDAKAVSSAGVASHE